MEFCQLLIDYIKEIYSFPIDTPIFLVQYTFFLPSISGNSNEKSILVY